MLGSFLIGALGRLGISASSCSSSLPSFSWPRV